jgi:hypothetical protein
MSKLHFYVNLKKDRDYIVNDFPYMLKTLGTDEFFKLLKKYYPSFESDRCSDFLSFWEKNKFIILGKLKEISRNIIREWKKREGKFFKKVAKELGMWRRSKYFCHISSTYICGGGYNYPTIIVFPFSKHVHPIDTIQHELLHLHVIEDTKRLKLKPKNYFKFSEIAVAFASKRIGIKLKFPNDEVRKFFKKIESMKFSDWDNFMFFVANYLNT